MKWNKWENEAQRSAVMATELSPKFPQLVRWQSCNLNRGSWLKTRDSASATRPSRMRMKPDRFSRSPVLRYQSTSSLFFFFLIYLAAPGFHYGMRDLHCGMQDFSWGMQIFSWGMWTLQLRHVGSSSLTRDWTRAPCIGSTESATEPPGKPPLQVFIG